MDTLSLALKEWGIVTEYMAEGRCQLILRKGGVYEDDGPGRFRLEHDRFVMFPAYEHERIDWLKPEFQPEVSRSLSQGEVLELRCWATVAGIYEVPSRALLESLDTLLPWDAPYLDMRFDYKPEKPLWLVLLQVYRLPAPVGLTLTAEHAGCRSWVPLDEGIDISGSVPVVSTGTTLALKQQTERAFGIQGK